MLFSGAQPIFALLCPLSCFCDRAWFLKTLERIPLPVRQPFSAGTQP